METLLNVLASKLTVQSLVETEQIKTDDCLTCFRAEFCYENVPDNIKEQFKDSLIEHLSSKLREIEIGEYVDYAFDCSFFSPSSSMNKYMEEVLSKLPSLDMDKKYHLPPDTFFKIKKVSNVGSKINLVAFSAWIAKEIYSQ